MPAIGNRRTPPQRTTDLSVGSRVAVGAVALVALALVVILSLVHQTVIVPAPTCAKAPPGCVVRVDGDVNPVLLIAFFGLAVVAALIASTGRVWKLSFGGASAEPIGLQVRAVSVHSALGAVAAAAATPDAAGRIALYSQIPPEIRRAADDLWSARYSGAALVESLLSVPGFSDAAGADGTDGTDGSEQPAYLIRAAAPRSGEPILLVVSPADGRTWHRPR